MNGRDLLEVIKKYGFEATSGRVSCLPDACPHCKGTPPRFRRHGVRKRLFLVFADWVFQRVWSYLTRWKCPLCKRTFTSYPDFALPFKRYPLPFILERCTAYLEDRVRTYREGVEEGGMPICHEDTDGGMVLWPSTLWRWVGAFGRFRLSVRQALNLIKQKDPSTDVFRKLGCLRIRADKYRSEARKTLLQRCRALTLADCVYRDLFSASLFPDLATRCGWR
jgi:hypothetical protein